MSHSILFYLVLGYSVVSGSITLGALGLLTRLHFFPPPPKPNHLRKLIPLGPDGAGLRSER